MDTLVWTCSAIYTREKACIAVVKWHAQKTYHAQRLNFGECVDTNENRWNINRHHFYCDKISELVILGVKFC